MNNDFYLRWFDLQVLLLVELWFYPYYLIGKQDDWKEWTNTSLSGWKNFGISQ